jgi:hypothetical protein
VSAKRSGGGKVGIILAHEVDHMAGDPVKEHLLDPEDLAEADGPADDPPKDVTPAFVGRKHSVADQKSRGPGMIRNDPEGDILFRMVSVSLFGKVLDAADKVFEKIGVVVGGHTLDHG